jgi:hypothetical protein
VMLGRGFACADYCASCGTGATTPLSPEVARRCGFDAPK